MQENNIVTVKNLVKNFDKKKAVNDVSFTIRKGITFGLLGTNGAGKTTIIKILTGQLLKTSGEVLVCGMDPAKSIKNLSNRIGIVTDNVSLYVDETVAKNLTFFSKLYGVKSKRVSEVIEMLGLNDFKNVKVKKLSKGYKQRVLIARSVLHDPELIIMDEPTSGLDANIAHELRKVIKDLEGQGKTILLTTHDMDEAEDLCKELLIIKDGNVVVNSSLADLQNSAVEKYVEVVTVNGSFKFKIDDLNKICQIPKESIISIHTNQYTLKEAFMMYTK